MTVCMQVMSSRYTPVGVQQVYLAGCTGGSLPGYTSSGVHRVQGYTQASNFLVNNGRRERVTLVPNFLINKG